MECTVARIIRKMTGVCCDGSLIYTLRCRNFKPLPIGFDQETIQQLLDACPETGARALLAATTGWSHGNRWVRCSNIFEDNGGREEYAGMDWLVSHNLAQIVFNGE